MYEELIMRLMEDKSWIEQGTTETEHEIADHLQKAADAIEELQKSVPRWIPVTELLPVRDVPVLVCLFGHSPYIAWISHEGEWKTDDFIIDSDYLPQAWMPLPWPPKEELE